MRGILTKDTFRSIARNKLRFLSVVIIIALGISFYIGIKSASPRMNSTANSYFSEYNLLDVRVTSRIPFSDDDIAKISELENVDSVVKSRYADAIVCIGNSTIVDKNGLEMSCRVSEFDASAAKRFTETGEADRSYVNRVKLVEGRYPENINECVIDSRAADNYSNIGIGTQLTLSGDGVSLTDSLKTETFTVVGTVNSPLYISDERGATQVGSGSLSAFIYVDSSNFSTKDVNELFVLIDGSESYDKFSVIYDDVVTQLAEKINKISSDVIDTKLADIKVDYSVKIADKEKEISDYEASSTDELAAKSKEKYDLKAYIDSEDSILEQEKDASEKEKAAAKAELDSQTERYDTLKAAYDTNVRSFENGSQKIDGYSELKKLYDDLSEKHSKDKKNLDSLEAAKNSSSTKLKSAVSEESKASSSLSTAESRKSTLSSEITSLESDLESYKSEKSTFESRLKTCNLNIEQTQTKINEINKKLSDPDVDINEKAILFGQKTSLDRELSRYNGEKSDLQKSVDQKASQIFDTESKISSKTKELDSVENDIPTLKSALNIASSSVNVAQTKYDSDKAAYDSAKSSYDADKATLNKYQSSMDALTSGQGQLLTLQNTIDSQERQLDALSISLTAAQIDYSLSVRNSDVKINQAQLALNDAKLKYSTIDKEYTALKAEVDTKKENLAGDLKMLKNTLKNVGSITWNSTVQTNLSGHRSFISSMENINSMSTIFPLLFMFTAMVACFVIMMKNVEDERNSIGLFKAFGYSALTVINKFLVYSTLAWILGSLLGIVIGSCVFPSAIYAIYGSTFNIPDINIAFNFYYIFRGIAVSFVTTTVASLVAAMRELRYYPAVLMRPKTISFTRRSLVEAIPALWTRLPYGMILLVRTISRSRKRVVVGTLAIGCCSALILSALGLLNSTSDVKNAQYSKDGIFRYDLQMVLNAEQNPEDSVTMNKLQKDSNVKSSLLVSNTAFRASKTESIWKGFENAHVIVPCDIDSIKEYVSFRTVSGSSSLGGSGVVISNKMADDLELNVGSKVYFTDNDGNVFSADIGGIVENYIDHYIYMSADTYKNVFGSAPTYKYILTVLKDYLTETEIAALSSDYLKTEEVTGVTNADSLADSVDISINQVLALVVIFVAAACVLAAIVMYTIANVNISERTHEIANIKVIGFTNSEVLLYVIRENIVSTIVGAILGLVGGIFLHHALVDYISVENVMYGTRIFWWSFIATILIIAVVAAAAALPIMVKINRVNVPETLKAVE